MKYILFAILIYIAYQFIFNLVIPVYRTSRKIRKGFREMSARMNWSDGQPPMEAYQSSVNKQNFATSVSQKPADKKSSDDYIDFEEIK